MRIALIGVGNLGVRVLEAMIANGLTDVIVTRRNEEELQKIKEKYSVEVTTDNIAAAKAAEVIILGVKPYALDEVAKEIKDAVSGKLVISIAAAKTISEIKATLSESRIARAMVGLFVKDEIAFYTMEEENSADEEVIKSIFGKDSIKVKEDLLNIRSYMGCDTGVLPMEIHHKIQALKEFGIDEETAIKTYGSVLHATGEQMMNGVSGEEIFKQVTGGLNPKAFTLRLYNELKEKGFFEMTEEGVRDTLKKLKG